MFTNPFAVRLSIQHSERTYWLPVPEIGTLLAAGCVMSLEVPAVYAQPGKPAIGGLRGLEPPSAMRPPANDSTACFIAAASNGVDLSLDPVKPSRINMWSSTTAPGHTVSALVGLSL